MEEIEKDSEFFKRYKNTNFNLIPLISGGNKTVYALTSTSQQGVVIFGNDYLLSFDKNNDLSNKKRLHNNIISVEYGKGKEEVFGTMHTHLPETGDFITATDLCTTMLFAKFAKWQQHLVVSEKYTSIWDCGKNFLLILPKDVIDKIDKDQEEKKKND